MDMRMYKYYSPNNFHFVFDKKTIRYTQPAFFNDPFECSPLINEVVCNELAKSQLNNSRAKIEREQLKAIPKLQRKEAKNNLKLLRGMNNIEVLEGIDSFNSNYHEQFQEKLKDLLNKNLGILCLTENDCCELMWVHYAVNHTGFLVEFDVSNSYFDDRKGDSDSLRFLRKVEYVRNRIEYSLDSLTAESLFLHKSKAWQYEKEFRITKALCDLNCSPDSDVYTEEFPFNSVKRVIFGVNCDVCLVTKYSKIIQHEHPNITLQKAVLDKKKFTLNYQNIVN